MHCEFLAQQTAIWKPKPKAKLLDMMRDGISARIQNPMTLQAMTAAMMLLGMGNPEDRDSVTEILIERFVAGKESLDNNATRAMGMVMQQGSSEAKQKIVQRVLENFANDEALPAFIQQLSRGIPGPATVDFLKSLGGKSEVDAIKGTSMMTLAQIYSSIPDAKGFVDDERFKAAFPVETIEFIKNFDPEEYAGEIEMLLTKVRDNFGDVPARRGTLGEMAASELFVIQHLSVGKEAPDIVGEDLDGEEFKLSDYRGKVVMLDFWGDW